MKEEKNRVEKKNEPLANFRKMSEVAHVPAVITK